ncbi:MAG: fgd1 2, partial [Frankiales bacterium]|nr:fgd1 2 [Frankiales bacterium]
EQIALLRALWDGGPEGVDFDGEFFSFAGAVSYPKPAHRIPIHVGGHSLAAARRAGRLGDGLQPLGVTGERLQELVTTMNEVAGRRLELSLGHLVSRITSDKAASLQALGATRIVLDLTPSPDLAFVKDELSACAERLGLS